ncbi:hypothetical protein [Hymenobacter sp. 102]|uniref:hypothetical protein n=1 Tax=Hymenobacter sp. 102 TaxID=3403152 RepID=UPI003CEC43D6
MKALFVLPVLLAASVSQQQAAAQAVSAAAAEAATVHFYQSKAYGFLVPRYRVYANGTLLCKLGRNSRCQVILPAGATAFTARIPLFTFGTPPPLAITLEPGKEYYLQGDVAPAGAGVAGLTYGFTEVVGNQSKLAQLEQAKLRQPTVAAGQ